MTNYPVNVEDERGHDFPICFSPRENLLAYVSAGTPQHSITITNIETGEHITHLRCSAPLAYQGLVFSPCGQYIAAVNQNNEMMMWNVYRSILEREPSTYDGRRLIPAYTPDGTLRIADIYAHKVVIWDAISNQKVDIIECKTRRHDHFSSDGAYYVTIRSRSLLSVWSIDSPSTEVSSPADHKPVPHSVAFFKNGKTIAS